MTTSHKITEPLESVPFGMGLDKLSPKPIEKFYNHWLAFSGLR